MINKQLLLVAAGIAVAAGLAFSQEFEVASIKPNKVSNGGGEGSRRQNVQATPGNLTMQNVSLRTAIQWAYAVQDYQVSAGPNWLDSDRYDIAAKPRAAASEDQLRRMLQQLLSDRFKLTLHHQSKELPAYVLTLGKSARKLQAAKGNGEHSMVPAGAGLGFENTSMPDLVLGLSNLPFFDRPVLDRTGLTGKFDFTLNLLGDQPNGGTADLKRAAAERGVALFQDALEQIGLRLESQKVAIDSLVIDRAEKPSEN